MASTSSSGHAEYEGNIDNLAGHGDQLVGSSSERIEEIPCVTVSTTVMEPRIKLQILATWLLGFWQYTCGVLGYLIPCLPSMQVSEREEADETTIGLNDQLNVWNDGSDDAERWVLQLAGVESSDMNPMHCVV